MAITTVDMLMKVSCDGFPFINLSVNWRRDKFNRHRIVLFGFNTTAIRTTEVVDFPITEIVKVPLSRIIR